MSVTQRFFFCYSRGNGNASHSIFQSPVSPSDGKLKRIFERIDDDSYQERLLKGPETIFFDPDGNMYTINHDANLIQVTDIQPTGTDHEFTANTTLVADVGVGRPLGATFTPDGSTTYMSDMVLGLTRIRNPHDPLSKVELVASSVVDDNGVKTRINLADDVIVGPKTGLVYFTDATVVYPEKDRNLMWDAMYASKIELMIGPTGRLLKYDPVTDKVSILLSDMWFANSVTVDQDERYLLFTESFSLRIGKYYLQGPKEGSVDYLVNGDPSPGCKLLLIPKRSKSFHLQRTTLTYPIIVRLRF